MAVTTGKRKRGVRGNAVHVRAGSGGKGAGWGDDGGLWVDYGGGLGKIAAGEERANVVFDFSKSKKTGLPQHRPCTMSPQISNYTTAESTQRTE